MALYRMVQGVAARRCFVALRESLVRPAPASVQNASVACPDTVCLGEMSGTARKTTSRGGAKTQWSAKKKETYRLAFLGAPVPLRGLRLFALSRPVGFFQTRQSKNCQKMRFKATMLLKTNKVDLVQSQNDSG